MTFSWNLLEYDTQLFGMKTAKITHVETDVVDELVQELKKQGVEYATHRIESTRMDTISKLESAGFVLVDGFVELEQNPETFKDTPINPSIRAATAADIPALRSLAASSFVYNRFYNDPLITKEQADTLFADWIENSVAKIAADEVFVYENEGDIVGFVTIKYAGEIPLIAVSKNMQGQGIAKKLISHALHTFVIRNPQPVTRNSQPETRNSKLSTVTIDTQLQNIPALRAYIRCGFLPTKSFFTYRWSPKSFK